MEGKVVTILSHSRDLQRSKFAWAIEIVGNLVANPAVIGRAKGVCDPDRNNVCPSGVSLCKVDKALPHKNVRPPLRKSL